MLLDDMLVAVLILQAPRERYARGLEIALFGPVRRRVSALNPPISAEIRATLSLEVPISKELGGRLTFLTLRPHFF